MENEKPTTLNCTVVAIDNANYYYRVCSVCDKTLPENSSLCNYCSFRKTPASSKRLFRLLVSIATDTKVFVVVIFDRAARVLFGSSADDLFHFAKLHPFSAVNAMKILEGEMLRVTLSKPKNGNAQHQRVVSVVPLSSDFRPAFVILKELYGGSADH